MSSEEIRESFLKFFSAQGGSASGGEERGHKIVPSSSLIPDDPSVLLTTAGMQQFKRYFTGELNAQKDFGTLNTASIQKCFRTSDIDEVGDETHLTFFEMLGHFSFGDYFKKETIEWTYQLLTEVFGISPERISATVFTGDDSVPFDKESYEAWAKILPKDKIRKGSRQDNFWGPAGSEGPCGACNEVYVDDVEVATLVFMEYYCNPDKSLKPLPKKGVDVGWGFERLVAMLQGKDDVFETDLFQKPFGVSVSRARRIIADHIRASVFLIADGVRPTNKDTGYILRRLIRRVIVQLGVDQYGLPREMVNAAALRRMVNVIDFYGKEKDYSNLIAQREEILKVFSEESEKFNKTLEIGLKEFNKQFPELTTKSLRRGEPYELQRVGQLISGDVIFYFHQTYGLTIDIIKDLAKERGCRVDEEGFYAAFKKHQEISRAGKEAKFGGHGIYLKTGEVTVKDKSELEKVTRLHTATHLLHAALRQILGSEVRQNGSDITVERTRFDFNFSRRLTPEELKKVEDLVNEVIKKDLPMQYREMSKSEAEKTGALYFFKEKYPERVKVYYAGHSIEDAFSKEFCGGPHVTHTAEIGKFKIAKEEAVGAGVRRIRGVVEP